MQEFDRKAHWEKIYNTKELKDVSWYQAVPQTSLDIITKCNVSKSAKIIDVGGGDSLLVDNLIKLGYTNLTVLDISEAAINRAKQRIGKNAEKITWIVADVTTFVASEKYDLWHDRAAFHFLTAIDDINRYIKTINESINPGGVLVIGTFTEQGPKKCSGIDIKQYSEESLFAVFNQYFDKLNCITVDHTTPFNTTQNFVFCVFKKR